MREKRITTKFGFGTRINPKLGDKDFEIVALQINKDWSIMYGCMDGEGDWKWFKDYEIKSKNPVEKVQGFVIKYPSRKL